jgi:hypothetical protein
MTCGGLCLLHSLQFTFDFEPLLVTGKYFEFTSYFQQAECLLAYQEDCDIYVVQCFAKLLADIGQRERSRYSDSQRNGRSGDPIPRKAIFSAPVQTGSETLPASDITDTRYLPVKEAGGVALTTHHYPQPILKVRPILLLPLLGLHGLF